MESADYQSMGDIEVVRVNEFADELVEFLREDARRVLESNQQNKKLLEKNSSEMWLVYAKGVPVLFLGLIPYTLLGQSTYMWTIPFYTLRAKHLKNMYRLLELNMNRFRTITAKVARGFDRGELFAKFFGFTPERVEDDMIIYVRNAQ